MKKNFVREKKIYCGQYMEVDIYQLTDEQHRYFKSGKRSKKRKVSAPKQRNLNEKNAKRYLTQLANSNFKDDDLHVTATYSELYLPNSVDEAEKNVTNYIRKINYRRKRRGLDNAKYIIVSEYGFGKNGGDKLTRIHHHIIMDKGLSRDELEDLWSKYSRKESSKLGYVNADRLQTNGNGLEALCKYLTKNPNGKKRWRSSQNLIKPTYRTNDHKYTRRQLLKIASECQDREYWQKKYKGYQVVNNSNAIKAEYNDLTGWSLYLKLKKLKE